MNIVDLKKLEQYQKEVARMQAMLAKQDRKLAALPAKHGYSTMDDFIAALKRSGGSQPAKKSPAPRRKRTPITPEIRQRVKGLVGQDKTVAEIAQAIGISAPSVQNIKKALGLVKHRQE